MYYYTTPKYNIALNAKVGSSTLARTIIREFYPEKNQEILQTKTPPHILENDKQWHWLCPGTTEPDKPVVIFVRDPIQRFISACQQIMIRDIDIDNAIESLINDTIFLRTPKVAMGALSKEEKIKNLNSINEMRYKSRLNRIINNKHTKEKFTRLGYLRDDVHFFHQIDYLQDKAYCFKFPENLYDGFEFIGIKKDSLPVVNPAKRQKASLTIQQLNSVSKYYENDINFYNSIDMPGKIIFRKDILCH